MSLIYCIARNRDSMRYRVEMEPFEFFSLSLTVVVYDGKGSNGPNIRNLFFFLSFFHASKNHTAKMLFFAIHSLASIRTLSLEQCVGLNVCIIRWPQRHSIPSEYETT